MSAYLLLFATAFGAATLLPFYSEVLLVAQLKRGLDPMLLWLFATAGNTLGAVVNWVIGWHLTHYVDRRWFQNILQPPAVERLSLPPKHDVTEPEARLRAGGAVCN